MFSNDQILAAAAGSSSGRLTPRHRSIGAMRFVTAETEDVARYLNIVSALVQDNSIEGLTAPTSLSDALLPISRQNRSWLHLIYAYMVENTRIYELFGRVLTAFNDGESLGSASVDSRTWLTTTEALFYRQQRAHNDFGLVTLTSDERADGRAIRRNAYFRMFGMDLNHGTDDNKPYSFKKPAMSNNDFVGTLEALLRQVWIAIIQASATAAPNPTDDAEIEHLTRRLQSMLRDRRLNGTLRREEFTAVATLDWLRLAISFNSPIVRDLRADASSEHERIRKIAQRVDLPSHGRSEDYLELSWRLAALLIAIEAGLITTTAQYLVLPQVRDIIHHWEKATGRPIKRTLQPVVSTAANANAA